MSDLIAYPGIQQWCEERRQWHAEEFGRVVDAIIARGTEPKAFSTYNPSEGVRSVSGSYEIKVLANYWKGGNPRLGIIELATKLAANYH